MVSSLLSKCTLPDLFIFLLCCLHRHPTLTQLTSHLSDFTQLPLERQNTLYNFLLTTHLKCLDLFKFPLSCYGNSNFASMLSWRNSFEPAWVQYFLTTLMSDVGLSWYYDDMVYYDNSTLPPYLLKDTIHFGLKLLPVKLNTYVGNEYVVN